MRELYELRDKLCNELKKYSGKELSKDSLEVVDTLAHATKNLDKIIDSYEEEENESYGYSNRMSRESYSRGRGRNAKRDSMGRYSRDNGYSRHGNHVEQLREMMMDAPNEEIRRDYEKIITHMESM